MKNITKTLLSFLLVGLLVFSSCDSFLEEDFRSGITTDNFFNNDKEAQLAVTGLYRLLHSGNLYRTRGIDNFYTHGADVVGPSRNVNGAVHNYQFAEGVSDGNGTWNQLYTLARNSALFLASIDGNEKLSESVRNQAVGEILFIRALSYYHLTNIWGDVPYFRELPSNEELSKIGRSLKAGIRDDMKEDLTRAITLLPASYSGSDLGRVSKWAAAMLKVKFHIFDKEWAQVKTECDFIINNSPHKLLDNFVDVFDQSNPADQYNDEQIFVVDFTADPIGGVDGNTSRTDDYNPRIRDEPKNKGEKNALIARMKENNDDMTGYGWSAPLPDFAKKENWQDGDLRYDATIVTYYEEFELNFPYFRKNWNLDQENSLRGHHPENFIVYRMADVYLMAAEAENEMNGPENAYPYVNNVRERAFEPDQPWSGMSKEQFRIAMYDERKFELCAEGHRRLDLIRWGILLDVVKSTVHRSWNNPAANIQPHQILYPIPLEEFLLNPVLLESDPTNNGYR
ncbi:MAG: RagB/SusD family nutrient uptake outer membrane protein [Draconibacterium sp.]|nr:RagB/SusD family nutrient uptake outer membrane protein [Draconibacterium sp.]